MTSEADVLPQGGQFLQHWRIDEPLQTSLPGPRVDEKTGETLVVKDGLVQGIGNKPGRECVTQTLGPFSDAET
jgi:hypothetical protein